MTSCIEIVLFEISRLKLTSDESNSWCKNFEVSDSGINGLVSRLYEAVFFFLRPRTRVVKRRRLN